MQITDCEERRECERSDCMKREKARREEKKEDARSRSATEMIDLVKREHTEHCDQTLVSLWQVNSWSIWDLHKDSWICSRLHLTAAINSRAQGTVSQDLIWRSTESSGSLLFGSQSLIFCVFTSSSLLREISIGSRSSLKGQNWPGCFSVPKGGIEVRWFS